MTAKLGETTLLPTMERCPNKLPLTSTSARAQSQPPYSSHSLLLVHLRDPARHSTLCKMTLQMCWMKQMKFVTLNNRYDEWSWLPRYFQLITRARLVATRFMVSQTCRLCEIDQLNEAGPASYLSPCLDPGLSWIADKVGDSTYQRNASSMVSAINQAVKLKRRIEKTRAPDPSPDLASLYIEGRIFDIFCHDIDVTNRDLLEQPTLRKP
jgi:hypothetical protein